MASLVSAEPDIDREKRALHECRSLLFVPANNPRAISKLENIHCDMVILDLEDAVPLAEKDDARAAAVALVRQGLPGKLIAVRMNSERSPHFGPDMVALRHCQPDAIVVPKVELPRHLHDVYAICSRPMIAMIETARGVVNAAAIAADSATSALLVGANDLAHDLRLPLHGARDRHNLDTALQTVVLAARASGLAVFDGVFNGLDDAEGFEAECSHGRTLGFDGKTLIHPNQVDIANRVFAPSADDVAEAERLIAAYGDGAERFEGRMIEAMHVAQAQEVLARTRR